MNARSTAIGPVLQQPHRAGALTPLERSSSAIKYGYEDSNPDMNKAGIVRPYPSADSEASSDSTQALGPRVRHCTKQCLSPLSQSDSSCTYIKLSQDATDASAPRSDAPGGSKLPSMRDSVGDGDESHRPNLSRSVIRHREFSFVSGDDIGRLPLAESGERATIEALEVYENGQTIQVSYAQSNNDIRDQTPAERHRGSRTRLELWEEMVSARPSKPYIGRESGLLGIDWQSSVTTTHPGRSAESSKDSEPVKDAPKRSKPSRSNEATIAAVRAVAEVGRTTPKSPRYDQRIKGAA